MAYRMDITGARAIAECTTCGERVPMSHVTADWQERHGHRQAHCGFHGPHEAHSVCPGNPLEAVPVARWLEAAEGEIWALDEDNAEDTALYVFDGVMFRPEPITNPFAGDMPKTDPRIIAGRRIWPDRAAR